MVAPRTRCAPLPLVGRGRGWGSRNSLAGGPTAISPARPPSPTLPHKGGGSRPSSPLALTRVRMSSSIAGPDYACVKAGDRDENRHSRRLPRHGRSARMFLAVRHHDIVRYRAPARDIGGLVER